MHNLLKCTFLIFMWNYCHGQVGYSPKTPGSDPYQPPNPYETTPASIPEGYEMTTKLFPLDSCYFNKHGFMCCNKVGFVCFCMYKS